MLFSPYANIKLPLFCTHSSWISWIISVQQLPSLGKAVPCFIKPFLDCCHSKGRLLVLSFQKVFLGNVNVTSIKAIILLFSLYRKFPDHRSAQCLTSTHLNLWYSGFPGCKRNRAFYLIRSLTPCMSVIEQMLVDVG